MEKKPLGWPLRSLCLVAALGVCGCEPLSMTALGIGGAAGVQHTLGGYTYRTFATPLPRVRTAVTAALGRMAITVAARERIANGEKIKARASDRDIEIELESLTPRTTRMRSTARYGIFMDAATANEIVLQTEKALRGA
jgi:hypothetical protein